MPETHCPEERKHPEDPRGPSARPSHLTVLVVEDDVTAQRLLEWMLPDAYAVDMVRNASDALDALRQTTYDVVLMDIELNGSSSGVDVLNAMSEDTAATTRIMAVTAYAMPGDREKFLAAGFDAYLAKPFTRDQFMTAFADLLAV